MVRRTTRVGLPEEPSAEGMHDVTTSESEDRVCAGDELLGDETTTWVRRDGTPFDPSHGLKATAIIEPAAAESLFSGGPKPLVSIRQTPTLIAAKSMSWK